MNVRIYSDIGQLPDSYAEMFREAEQGSYFYSMPWFRNLIQTTVAPGETPRLYGIESGARSEKALALLVARKMPRRLGPLSPRTLGGYANMYTTLFGPALGRSMGSAEDIADQFAQGISADASPWDVVQFDSLDHDSAFFGAFVDSLRKTGMVVQPYFHFGNWFEDTSHGSLEAYLGRRPSQVRNTLKRKGKKLDRSERADYGLVTDENGLEAAIEGYEQIYATSWKQPEPFPDFTPGLARTAAAAGSLRLGTIRIDGEPAAAQLWIVAGGCATIFKLAHDEHYKDMSLGSILTARMAQHVIEVDGVGEIDFGRGDDPYKSQWLSQRRERWGIIAFNPRTLHGAIRTVRHLGGRVLRRALPGRGGRTASTPQPQPE